MATLVTATPVVANPQAVKTAWEPAGSVATISLSTYMAASITQHRNGPSNQDIDIIERFGRRVAGAAGYGLVFVVALVEMVVRTVLLIPTAIMFLTSDDEVVRYGRFFNDLTAMSLGGVILTGYTLLASPLAQIQNIYMRTIHYDNLLCCEDRTVQAFTEKASELKYFR